MRSGAPARVRPLRKNLASLATLQIQQQALQEFSQAVFADSSRESVCSKLRTIERIFALWAIEPIPPTVRSVAILGASLKWCGYRSAEAYLSTYRVASKRLGFEITPELEVAFADAIRSSTRGIGGPTRARGLPFERLHSVSDCRESWCIGGPLSPRNVLVVGAWWLLREVELATCRAAHVEIRPLATGATRNSVRRGS